jgi:hypothetical protein
MIGIRPRTFSITLVTILLLALGGPRAYAAGFVGRPVTDVLAELRGPDLDFIYSSELLPQTLTVTVEPTSGNRLLIAREILAAHGLSLTVVRPGLFAVTSRTRAPLEHPVRGRILSAADDSPVAKALVRLLPVQALDWTDDEGRFQLAPVPEGRYTLHVEAAGYETLELAAFTVAEYEPEAELRLTPATVELAEIVVSTSRYALEHFGSLGSVNIAGDALAAQPGPGEDALRALGRLPGMAQDGLTAQSNIRGGEAAELLTLLDGFPLRETFHLPAYHDVFGVLDPGLIGEAEIFTGGFPARYGNRMAGVFDLHTIDPGAAPHTSLGLSVFNAMARSGGSLAAPGIDWLVMGRAGTLKEFIQTFADEAGSPSYGDVYARMGWGTPERLRITANVLWSRDELDISREPEGEGAYFESKNRYLWLRADHEWANGVEATVWFGESSIDGFREGSIDNPGVSSGSVTDRRSSEYSDWRGRVSWQPNPRNWLEGGFEFTEEDATYRYDAVAAFADAVAELFSRDAALARSASLRPHRERFSLYATHRWQVLDPLVSELGLRAQRTLTAGSTAEEWRFDPRVNLRWRISPATSLRAHWGRFHQTDEVHELKVEDGLEVFPDAQRSDQAIVGVDHRLDSGLALRIEWFRKLQSDPRPRFENLLDPMSLLPEIAPDRVEVAPLAAEVRGAEISAVSEHRDLTWWLGLVWSEAWDSLGGRREPRNWDQTWAVTAGIDWVRGQWRFGAVAGSHRGWPTTRVRDDELSARNSDRFGDRATLDLRAEYRRPLAIGSLAVTLEVTNAINVGNTCCQRLIPLDDGAGGTSFATQESDWLPVVPSIGVLWEF